MLLGGAAAPAGLLDAARTARVPVVTTYGMTETCGGCVYDGIPLDGVGIKIDDEDAASGWPALCCSLVIGAGPGCRVTSGCGPATWAAWTPRGGWWCAAARMT